MENSFLCYSLSIFFWLSKTDTKSNNKPPYSTPIARPVKRKLYARLYEEEPVKKHKACRENTNELSSLVDTIVNV